MYEKDIMKNIFTTDSLFREKKWKTPYGENIKVFETNL